MSHPLINVLQRQIDPPKWRLTHFRNPNPPLTITPPGVKYSPIIACMCTHHRATVVSQGKPFVACHVCPRHQFQRSNTSLLERTQQMW